MAIAFLRNTGMEPSREGVQLVFEGGSYSHLKTLPKTTTTITKYTTNKKQQQHAPLPLTEFSVSAHDSLKPTFCDKESDKN